MVAAVRAQLDDSAAAAERPGLAAIAIALAAVLDNQSAVPQHASAAHRLVEVLGALSKVSARRGRLSLVRGMTGDAPKASTSRGKSKPANGPGS